MITIDDIASRQTAILWSLATRRVDLDRYDFTINTLRHVDVWRDPTYQRTFNGLYMVRRNYAWRTAYFAILQAHKDDQTVQFGTILQEVFEETGRVEASFASKLVATINPNNCIYDSVIRMNLAIPARAGPFSARVMSICGDYRRISDFFESCIATPQFRDVRQAFDGAFPDYLHFSDIKVLDFMIWQMR